MTAAALAQPLDAFFADGEAAAAIERAGDALALVAYAPLDEERAEREAAGGAALGPLPGPVEVALLQRGDSAIDIGGERRTVERAVVSCDRVPWGGGVFGPAFEKWRGRVTLEGGEWAAVVAELVATGEEEARAQAEELAAALRDFLGLGGAARPEREPLPAAPAPRFGVRFEAGAIVLRDHRSAGPRADVGRYRALALGVAVLAAIACYQLFLRLREGASGMVLFGHAVVAVVLVLGVVAMGEIARFGSKYRASSEPRAWFASDRVVVEPWVSREGAVNLSPEGRLGAGIPTAEIASVETREVPEGYAVMLDGPHGPITVLTTEDAAEAKRWRATVERALAAAASPKRREKRREAA